MLLQGLFAVAVVCSFFIADVLNHGSHTEIFIAGVILLTVAFGIVLTRFTLGPTRKMQQLQKLFISNVAHELRTPLATIKTSSEVALLDTTLDAGTRDTFTDIVGELNRISEIINNLLSLTSLTRPERMKFTHVDLLPLVEGVIKKHQDLARERGIRCVLRAEPGSVAWGNRAAFEQIVTNIIKNALLYTPKNTDGVVTVSVRPVVGSDTVLFSVADTGVGMSQDEIFHAFEPFYRGDASRSRKAHSTGSGLGLTIINELVRTHHGKIHVESKKRKGTTVSVRLPRSGRLPFSGTDADRREAPLDFTDGSSQER